MCVLSPLGAWLHSALAPTAAHGGPAVSSLHDPAGFCPLAQGTCRTLPGRLCLHAVHSMPSRLQSPLGHVQQQSDLEDQAACFRQFCLAFHREWKNSRRLCMVQ